MSKGFVYVVGRGEPDDPVKIGWSATPEKRLGELQVGSPHVLQLLDKHPGPDDLERFLHDRFAPFRLHGEWFLIENAVQQIAEAVQSWGGREAAAFKYRPGAFSLEHTMAMLGADSGITGDDFRVFLFCGAKTRGRGSVTVNEVVEHLGLTPQGVRRICKKLADAGILLVEDVEGRTIRYRTSAHIIGSSLKERRSHPLPTLPGRPA